MLASTPRVAVRSTRALRVRQPIPIRARQPRNIRQASNSTNTQIPSASSTSSSSTSGGSSGALAGGIAGGVTALLVGYSWYHFSGAKSVVNSIHQAKSYVNSAFKKTTDAAPEPNQAVEWLRDTVKSYTKMIPGASGYVDKAFEDLEKIRQKHGDEVDSIIHDTYNELKGATNKGFSVEAVEQAWDIIQKCFSRIASLAVDAGQDIMDNHPQLQEKLGGSFSQLKQMGNEYGPEAKQKVDETYQQVRDILKGGIGFSTISELQKLLQDKTQELKKYGDAAWQKGFEQAKPLFDKQPQLKEFIEKNKDKLLQGDLGQLWNKVQEAVKSGNTDDVEKFVKEQVNSMSQKAGGGIEQYLQMIPGGSEIGSKLQQLQELSQKHGKEAEQLAKSAMDDIKNVLSKKVEEGQKLKEKVEKDAKR
ncbi:hypothetical protein LTR10_019938 [Elasticomyces elasticus]|uniref:Uncharacterized protein n=1 Tax=Exophiala sideris TaxID=1016849 RepID=A0ABR0J9N9_9EURO|nr:hypothetical protein LTR10_019938 [Elasticomyces elasticus]KAK5022774.1 hypothetical protein LTS07_009752 [Exophiala sideris]KAK5026676.1 hypothetical protein LTR13_009900 [Exophiala sideris]KAK5059401.1 hypothetical protein LTR69_005990 [Exophiala sideris]KAK5177454.1 hypothetical protein LTR44_010070 [Eurotiomycetes sp. CCFEE 6388]